mmetsp:Transcript_39115/g.114236  ORF Transcript_39115/g.114236 Transcript_39115/m.114236 type:complete len:112 (-) Transcript_39115:122-457(-)|eukprot:5966441-Prymnesium_polylepis.2
MEGFVGRMDGHGRRTPLLVVARPRAAQAASAIGKTVRRGITETCDASNALVVARIRACGACRDTALESARDGAWSCSTLLERRDVDAASSLLSRLARLRRPTIPDIAHRSM